MQSLGAKSGASSRLDQAEAAQGVDLGVARLSLLSRHWGNLCQAMTTGATMLNGNNHNNDAGGDSGEWDNLVDRTGRQFCMPGSNVALNSRLYVEIVPLEAKFAPAIHPIRHANFDPGFIYKVLGIHIPSETSEYYMLLTNTRREIWLISNRHLRMWGVIDSDELFISRELAPEIEPAHAN
jgi:hypothetical protein